MNFNIRRIKVVYKNFTGFYEKGVEALNKLQNQQNKGKNQKVEM